MLEDNIDIYGILNEDRRIFWISDLWYGDAYGEVSALEDAIWKNLMIGDEETLKLLENADGNVDVVILESVKRDEWNVEKLMRWIDIFDLKNYVICSPEKLMDFKMEQEKAWDEEDRRFFGIEE